MANINLTDGNTYTFAKVNGKATILDSSDSAHAKKTLRKGLEVTGSVNIDAPNSSDGIRIYSNGEISHAIYTTGAGNTGYIQTYTANGNLINKLDDDGKTIINPQGIDQAKLVPLLVKTIQELEARITALESK